MVSTDTDKFPRSFWVVNTLELLERGAYYAVWAILSYHIVYNLGYNAKLAGLLNGFMFPLLYFIPIVAAVLGQKYGFKKMIIVAFILMITGYVLFFLSLTTAMLFFSATVMGIGAGIFKPQVSATVTHVTKASQRNKAFSIYYWMINFGATSANILVAAFIGPESYHVVFAVSAIITCVNLITAFFFFEDPTTPKKEMKVLTELTKGAPVLKDKTFLMLLLIYPGFWIMYAQQYTVLPLYMSDFGLMPPWFSVALLAAVNPGTIILTGPYLSKFVEKYNSLHMMILGMMIAITGFAMVGFIRTSFAFILGVVIFSVGEFIVHPNFISYTSKIAPKEKVTQYMGWIFLPSGIGLLVGSLMGGQLYSTFGEGSHQPGIFWSIMCAVGAVTIAAFILYNLNVCKKDLYCESDSLVEQKPLSLHLERPIAAILALTLVPIFIIAGAANGNAQWLRPDIDGTGDPFNGGELQSITELIHEESGYINEGQTWQYSMEHPGNEYTSLEVKLVWLDNEPEPNDRYYNEPDEFFLTITSPSGETYEDTTDLGFITMTVQLREEERTGDNWTITVQCVVCGDITPTANVIGLREIEDVGSDWDVEIRINGSTNQ